MILNAVAVHTCTAVLRILGVNPVVCQLYVLFSFEEEEEEEEEKEEEEGEEEEEEEQEEEHEEGKKRRKRKILFQKIQFGNVTDASRWLFITIVNKLQCHRQ